LALAIPTSVEDLKALAPAELREMCRVIRAILAFCDSEVSERMEGAFDRDELGIDPEDDYDLFEDEED